MKFLVAVLLACLLIAGTVSAASFNPSSVGVVKTAVTTIPQVTKLASSVQPAALATEDVWIVVNIASVPSGATVKTDGSAGPDVTPVKLALRPGSHTIVLSHAMFEDYTIPLTLKAGMPSQYITANLKRLDIVTGAVRTTETTDVPDIQARQNVTMAVRSPTGKDADEHAVVQTLETPAVLVTLAVTTAVPVACPNSDWSCLTPAEAAQQFGYPNARYGDDACGYSQSANQTVVKYCFMDVPSGGSISSAALGAQGIRNGADIFVANDTGVEHGVVNLTAAAEKPAANAGPVQSFFDFLSGIFSGSSRKCAANSTS